MIIRTISQLPRTINYYSQSLFEISEPCGNGLYSSRSMSLSTLQGNIENAISSTLTSVYSLNTNGHPVDVGKLERDITTLSSEDMTIHGQKFFEKLPNSTETYAEIQADIQNGNIDDEDHVIPNIGITKKIIQLNSPVHIGTTQSFIADGNPFSSSHGKINIQYGQTAGKDDVHFYMWSIEDNKTDSSETTWDLNSGTRGDYEQMRDTGWLTIWGWLADRGDVEPANAWVGLFGQIQYEGATTTTSTWFPIQIQPWIKGVHASTLQYVGFGIPVRKGLRLKICTGFKVYGSNTGGFQDKSETLTFRDRWIPNTFFGYVIKNSED